MEDESDQEQTSMNSIVHIRASELFPKKSVHSDDPALCVPFPTLYGESVEYLGRATEGTVALSNYRLFVLSRENFYNIPLGLIESIESRDIFFLYVYCKDARTLRFTFSTNEHCLEWYRRLSAATAAPKRLEDIFSFAFYAWCCEDGKDDVHHSFSYGGGVRSNFTSEVERMGFDLRYAWRISKINHDYSFCSSYPREMLVPTCVRDDELEQVAEFRSSRRIPVVVWRHQRYGSIVARSSQPMVGWFGCRKLHDEKLIHAIAAACASDCGPSTLSYSSSLSSSSSSCSSQEARHNSDILAEPKEEELVQKHALQKLLIIDARSYAAAVANRAKGGGCECQEYYPNCEIQFMSLANIHSIRRSFQSVRLLCAMDTEQSNWLSVLEGTKWLHHMSGLLKAALAVVKAVDVDRRPVLVHCSDGWDRTPQIVALAELMLDPYYRTIDGFQVLVEKEWLEFGHKFGDRCGHGLQADDVNERCPVFLQWLDCVYQVLKQSPCSFEFNENFLVKLAQHTYSCLFGTFLCNSVSERQELRVPDRTYSVWAFLRSQQNRFLNVVYAPKSRVLRPLCQVRDLTFWSTVYLQGFDSAEDPLTVVDGDARTEVEDLEGKRLVAAGMMTSTATIPKTRSCDDLSSMGTEHTVGRHRRCSDPNLVDSLRGFGLNVSNEQLPTAVNGQQSSPKHTPPNPFAGVCNGKEGYDEQREEMEERTATVTRVATRAPLSACESSTDTLVGDLAPEVRGVDDHREPSRYTDVMNGTDPALGTDEGVELGEDVSAHIASSAESESRDCRNNLENLTTVSTSTSDLSDSRIRRATALMAHAAAGSSSEGNGGALSLSKCPLCTNGNRKLLEVKLRQLAAQGGGRGVPTPPPAANTPLHSRTPSSGFPATPNDDRLSECAGACGATRGQGGGGVSAGLWRKFDLDGFTLPKDEVQQRLVEIVAEQQAKVHALERKLGIAHAALCQQVCQRCCASVQSNAEHNDEALSLSDSIGSGEHQSLGQESNSASDVSWEQVEEKETRPTLWVPDHAVTRCMGCGTEFWLGKRKHHCRKCGRIFCSHCSSQEVPVPSEHFYDPVRVCSSCYEQLLCKQQIGAMIDAKLLMTAATATTR